MSYLTSLKELKTLERFTSKLKQIDNCWVWIGWKDKAGYGHFSYYRIWHLAHRVAYELFKGEIPKGLTIDHLCKNRACCNPEHLEAVTQKENTLRGNNPAALNSKKTHCKRGHEFTPENTYFHDDQRYCKTCVKTKQAKFLKINPNYQKNYYLSNKDKWKEYAKNRER